MRRQTATKPVAKERVRGDKLRVLVKRANGVAFERALVLVDEGNLVMASNKRMDKALVNSNEWRQVNDGLWCWTGTMTGYSKPNSRLGTNIEYTDPNTNITWVFPVPKQYRRERNAILVAEHPDYTLETDGNKRIVTVPEDKVGIVLAFPTGNEWYLTDSNYGIPTMENGDESAGQRYLQRTNKRVGPVVRFHNVLFYFRQLVDLGNMPSQAVGVVIEATAGGAPAVETRETPANIRVTEQSGKLIVEGTPGQLEATKRKLAELK